MPSDFPDDREFVMNEVLRTHERERRGAANEAHGDPVEDISKWNGKELADPTAGTGDGSFCEPQKKELI